jgi:hypothetical protein
VGVGHERKHLSMLTAYPGRMPSEWLEKGWVKKADGLKDLGLQVGVDPDRLVKTVERFNLHAVRGEDPDFGRGRGAFNAMHGDPGDKVNPCVGPLDNPPSMRRLYIRAMSARAVGWCATSSPRSWTRETHPSPVYTQPVT